MKKLVIILMHCSSGGMPQYALKKIQSLINDYDIYCIEYSFYGYDYIVQRKQIESILGDKFYSLSNNKEEILDIISSIDPDIIHFEELPEMFMSYDIAEKIYNKKDRKYFIVASTHDSSWSMDRIRFLPDHFTFVSQYSLEQFQSLNIPSSLVLYPIDYKVRTARYKALNELNLDPMKRHVINVGLWTSRKNQGELINYAKELIDYPIEFHFIGNQAPNFSEYWGPLMKDLPSNCHVYGERDDVDKWYDACDLMVFTSKPYENNKETSPIVIREAISWQIPSLIYNLDVYLGMYNEYDTINYLKVDGDKIEEGLSHNSNMILTELGWNDQIKNISYIISTHPNTKAIEETTIKCIDSIKNKNSSKVRDIIVSSHCDFSDIFYQREIIREYDSNNPIIDHNYYNRTWFVRDNFYGEINLTKYNNNKNHAIGVHNNYYNGILNAHYMHYSYVICTNFDIIFDEEDLKKLEKKVKQIFHDNKKAYFMYSMENEGHTLKTVLFISEIKFYLDNFEYLKSEEDYINSLNEVNSPTNCLENYYYHVLKNKLDDISIEEINESDLLSKSKINLFSQIEYSTVLPLEGNDECFVVWFNSNNIIDNRILNITVIKNEKVIFNNNYNIVEEFNFTKIFKFYPNDIFKIIFDISYTLDNKTYTDTKEIVLDDESFKTVKENGNFRINLENLDLCESVKYIQV